MSDKNKKLRLFKQLLILILFWIVWFWIYSLLNSRGAQIGIHWDAPNIYIPLMVYPYVFGMLILVVFPFALHLGTDRFFKILGYYCITSLIMFAIYYFYPVYLLRREYTGPLIADALMRWIVGMDDPANCFPSNHCAVATMGFITVYIAKIPAWLKQTTGILTVVVCLSTVLVGQHYWIDIPTGIALAVIVYFIIFKFSKIKVVS